MLLVALVLLSWLSRLVGALMLLTWVTDPKRARKQRRLAACKGQ